MTLSATSCGGQGAAVSHDPVAIADDFRTGMRMLAAGVCLITTRQGDELGGMIATAVTSVSAEPPTLLVCINRTASIFEMIEASQGFCVNVLATEAVPLVEQFSSSARRAERFQSGAWSTSYSGAPVSADAVVAFDCQLAKKIDWHSHGIFLGEVRGVVHPRSGVGPLLYMDRRFHHLRDLPSSDKKATS